MKDILIIFLGLLFIFTGIHRFVIMLSINKDDIRSPSFEITETFGMYEWFKYLIIILEVLVGCILLFSKSTKIVISTLYVLLVFIFLSCSIILIKHFEKIRKTYIDAFTFHPTFTCFFLHITYGVICLGLILKIKY